MRAEQAREQRVPQVLACSQRRGAQRPVPAERQPRQAAAQPSGPRKQVPPADEGRRESSSDGSPPFHRATPLPRARSSRQRAGWSASATSRTAQQQRPQLRQQPGVPAALKPRASERERRAGSEHQREAQHAEPEEQVLQRGVPAEAARPGPAHAEERTSPAAALRTKSELRQRTGQPPSWRLQRARRPPGQRPPASAPRKRRQGAGLHAQRAAQPEGSEQRSVPGQQAQWPREPE